MLGEEEHGNVKHYTVVGLILRMIYFRATIDLSMDT